MKRQHLPHLLKIFILLFLVSGCNFISLRVFPKVEQPVFSQPAGSYDATFDITITSATNSAGILYTTDGSTPSSKNGTWYNGPVEVRNSITLSAIALKDNYKSSTVTTTQYIVVGEIDVLQGSYPVLDGSSIYNTSTVDLSTDHEVIFTIYNNGTSDLRLSSITLETTSDAWTTGQPSNSIVPPDFSTNFIVVYNPKSYDITRGIVTIGSNDLDEGIYTFIVEGTAWNESGSFPEIHLKQGGTDVISGVYDHNFGTQEFGTSSSQIIFTIENNGTTPLILLNSPFVQKSGDYIDYFSITQPLTATISASSSHTFAVVWQPFLIGDHTIILTIPNNDQDENPYAFSMHGTCADTIPPVAGPPATLVFGPVLSDRIKVTWTAGSDNTGIAPEYLVYYSTSDNIGTAALCQTNGTPTGVWESGNTNKQVTPLSSGTLYYINVVIRDSVDNRTAYTMGSSSTTP